MNGKSTLFLAALSLTLACGAPPADMPATDTAASAATSAPAAADGHDHGDTAAPAAAAPAKNFPPLDYLQRIPVAYRVARENPEILAKIPCYCPCMLYGHGDLTDCHRSQHSAGCATCLDEAVMAGQLIQQMGTADPDAVAAQEGVVRPKDLLRHAVRAAEVTAVGHGDAQVAHGAAKGVGESHEVQCTGIGGVMPPPA